jgi:hypothetical protein
MLPAANPKQSLCHDLAGGEPMPSHAPSVPVDQRWLGMDKRGLPYALIALVLLVVLTRVVPAVNAAIEWDDPVKAGDVIDLGGGIQFTPPVGWQLEDGVRVGAPVDNPVRPESARALLVNGNTEIAIVTGKWDGTADELLDQTDRLRNVSGATEDQSFKVTGDRTTFTTTSGIVGVAEPYTSATGDGTAYAFVVEPPGEGSIGIVINVGDASDSPSPTGQQARDAIASLTVQGANS